MLRGKLSRNLEQLVDEADFIVHAWLARQAMTASDHAHHLEALESGSGYPYRLKPSRGTGDSLQRAMIGFDNVVQVLRCLVPSVRQQTFFAFELLDDLRIGT